MSSRGVFGDVIDRVAYIGLEVIAQLFGYVHSAFSVSIPHRWLTKGMAARYIHGMVSVIMKKPVNLCME